MSLKSNCLKCGYYRNRYFYLSQQVYEWCSKHDFKVTLNTPICKFMCPPNNQSTLSQPINTLMHNVFMVGNMPKPKEEKPKAETQGGEAIQATQLIPDGYKKLDLTPDTQYLTTSQISIQMDINTELGNSHLILDNGNKVFKFLSPSSGRDEVLRAYVKGKGQRFLLQRFKRFYVLSLIAPDGVTVLLKSKKPKEG